MTADNTARSTQTMRNSARRSAGVTTPERASRRVETPSPRKGQQRAAAELARRPVGRPRSGTADRAILDAALALLAEAGVIGLTMSAVVSRSGVARATVYRRYPTREALIAATLAQVKGREPFPLTGDVPADIATGVVWAAAVLQEARFRRFLPHFVAEVLHGPAAARNRIDPLAPDRSGV